MKEVPIVPLPPFVQGSWEIVSGKYARNRGSIESDYPNQRDRIVQFSGNTMSLPVFIWPAARRIRSWQTYRTVYDAKQNLLYAYRDTLNGGGDGDATPYRIKLRRNSIEMTETILGRAGIPWKLRPIRDNLARTEAKR